MFQAHIELLQSFLASRHGIVEKLQDMLNAQRKPPQQLQDRPLLARQLEDCFFLAPALGREQSELRGQLEQAHRASGFNPRAMPGLHNDLINPAEMTMRGFFCWQKTRWPGRAGRLRYAQTLFNLYLLRQLELLSMRLWDDGTEDADNRLILLQVVLDDLWKTSPNDQPVLVRDARWLIPLAQSPTTDELAAYFTVAGNLAETLSPDNHLEACRAHTLMIGGHLRSQIRHYCLKERLTLESTSVILRTRASNALDFALLIQCLVPLLKAFELAQESGDEALRLIYASAVCQGLSVDPEVFVNRLDLLGAYSMIEHLFIEADSVGAATYTALGRRHLQLLDEYIGLIRRLAPRLNDDVENFRPVADGFSPYGAIFGSPTNLTENMAMKTLQRDTVNHLAMEDVFIDSDESGERLRWVVGWRDLPHIDPKLRELWAYPHSFAVEIFERIEQALQRFVAGKDGNTGTDNSPAAAGRLILVADENLQSGPGSAQLAGLDARFVETSDKKFEAAGRARFRDQSQLLRDRQEGHYLLSYETENGWVAIRKHVLTEVLGEGQAVRLTGLPTAAANVLELMCPGLDAEIESSG